MAHSSAGKRALDFPNLLVDPGALCDAYYSRAPNLDNPAERVSFGTSGHRGSPLEGSFNEAHILATTQAICEYRAQVGTTGPLFLGKDTHAVSRPAERTALEVLAANGVEVRIQSDDGYTPTPSVSFAILSYNRNRTSGLADGVVVTPSHNPPADGGFKYNPTHGGPADTDATGAIEARANEILAGGCRAVRRLTYERARVAETTVFVDFLSEYIRALPTIVDIEAIRQSGVRLGADPLGGASVAYWLRIAEQYGLALEVVNLKVDPTFSFMPLDHDGKIRMDCSSPYAMTNLVALGRRFDVAFGNDPDADRHGIVTPKAGLLNPNHYLAVAIRYLFQTRSEWAPSAAVGKTLVSSGLVDRVARSLGRPLFEVPVGFKWFVPGLLSGALGFGGEESAGASFLRFDGSAWTTDKDGIVLGLLAAEITAKSGKDPGEWYDEIRAELGTPYYARIDAPASPEEKSRLKALSPEAVLATELAGEPIALRMTRAPGNGASIGGLKISAENGWFAARPSGTENVYKIYAESFVGQEHLDAILAEARAIVARALAG
jgi:phosphoglucomutase